MTVYDWFQLIGGVILALGYLPQIRQLLTSRSCRDLNLKTYVALAAGIGMMEIYAYNLWVHDTAAMFFATNTISLAMVLYIIILIKSVRNDKEGNRQTVKSALYATKYIDDSVIITPCEVNMRTKEVFNIVPCYYDCGCCMDGEFVLIDNEEFPCIPSTDREPFDDNFWYES
jgi:MtN3 and saliva related transmembrane protein